MKIHCQLQSLETMAQPLGTWARIWQRRNRIKRIVKRRWRWIQNLLHKSDTLPQNQAEQQNQAGAGEPLKPGDAVRVRSREEIRTTLDKWNQLKGCSFMEEMWPYCGTTQRVYKRVEKFLDERDYLMKNCNGIVILDGVVCQGTKDFGPCDRACFYFWREEWLEKID